MIHWHWTRLVEPTEYGKRMGKITSLRMIPTMTFIHFLTGKSSGILTIWHIYWHSIWHSIWHILWHMFWHIFWHIFWHSIWQIFWHSIWHIFWHSIWHIFWHSIWHIFWHIFWHSIWHSIWHIFWHSIWPLRSGSAHCDLEVAVEVRQCPLRSGSRGWGPAVPSDLEVAVEVRQCPLGRLCPLGSGARGGGPAVPTGIWTARRRRRRRTALIKSNNPHLAGGEKNCRKMTETWCTIKHGDFTRKNCDFSWEPTEAGGKVD